MNKKCLRNSKRNNIRTQHYHRILFKGQIPMHLGFLNHGFFLASTSPIFKVTIPRT
jgi:hypothetical protein